MPSADEDGNSRKNNLNHLSNKFILLIKRMIEIIELIDK